MKIEKFYVLVNQYNEIHDEYCDKNEARHYNYLMPELKLQAACAEVLNDNGDLGETFFADTMAEAMRKLKCSK